MRGGVVFNLFSSVIYYPTYPQVFIVTWPRRVSFKKSWPVIRYFAFVFIQIPTISCFMQTQGTNGTLRTIVVSVVGGVHRGRSRVFVVDVVVAIVIAVASPPTSEDISAPALVAPPVLVLLPSLFISWPFCFSSSSICFCCLSICACYFMMTFNRSSFCVVICCMCSLLAVAATATSRIFFARRWSPLSSSALA